MRRATALRHLATVAAECQRASDLGHGADFALRAAYAFGDLLDGAGDVAVVEIAFVLRLPPCQVTWLADPPDCRYLVHVLRLDKVPVAWYWRPEAWPAGNHLIRRPVRFWSAEAGIDEQVLRALSQGDAEPLRLPTPPPEQERQQLATELAASLTHLQATQDSYWARDWRREHRGDGSYPENHLWNAVQGYLELLSAGDTR